MAKSQKGLTKADIARLGPVARQQVMDQLGGTVVSLPRKPRRSQEGSRAVIADVPMRLGLGPTKARSRPWGPFYPVMLIILLIILWDLLEGALS